MVFMGQISQMHKNTQRVPTYVMQTEAIQQYKKLLGAEIERSWLEDITY